MTKHYKANNILKQVYIFFMLFAVNIINGNITNKNNIK